MAAADRPLLVVHDPKEGHLVYDLLLLLDAEESDEALVCLPRPVAHFPFPLDTSAAFAVAGGSVLGVRYDFWSDTLFHDSVMQFGGYDLYEKSPFSRRDAEGRVVRCSPKTRIIDGWRGFGNYKDMPALLPMEDGTVVLRMDTVLFHGIYVFERFHRLLLPGGEWHAVPLPKPPIGPLGERECTFVSSCVAIGARVWISVDRKGTFSLDTERGEWRVEGTWKLPFEGRALYVPELGSVIGLAEKTVLLCAYDIKAGTPPVTRHEWRETLPRPHEECCSVISSETTQAVEVSRPRDMPSLAYLGKGKICICRPMTTKEINLYFGPRITYDACSFLTVELKRLPNGQIQLAKRGRMTYMWPPQGRQCRYLGFIQPAIPSNQASTTT